MDTPFIAPLTSATICRKMFHVEQSGKKQQEKLELYKAGFYRKRLQFSALLKKMPSLHISSHCFIDEPVLSPLSFFKKARISHRSKHFLTNLV